MNAERTVTIELNPREQRLYEQLRGSVTSTAPRALSGVIEVLLLLPDLAVLLFRLTRDPRVPVASKAIAALGVAYVLSPIELLPELLLGPIGLIDDLIVVAAALSRLLNHVHPDVVRMHWAGEGDALAAIQRTTDWVEQTVTARVRAVLQRFLGPA